MTRRPLSPTQMFLGIALVGILVRGLFVWTGWIEGSLLADDAYYYFKIAANIISGKGSTFDGLSSTNGYHPLWMVVLLPVFKLFRGSLWVPIRVAVSLCVVFDWISGWIIFRMLRRAKMEREGLIAAAFWFCSPFTLFLGLRGMESSLSAMIILALTWQITTSLSSTGGLRFTSAVVTGCLLGMAGLARTDNLVPLGLMVAFYAGVVGIRRSRRPWSAVLWLAGVAVLALAVMSPWLAWNYRTFGTFLQVSAAVKLYSKHLFGSMTSDWKSLTGIMKSLSYPVLAPVILPARFTSGEEFRHAVFSYLVALGIFVPSILLPFLARREIAGRVAGTIMADVLPLAVGYMLVHTVLYGFVGRTYANWYALPYFSFLSILFGVSLPVWWVRVEKRRAGRSAAIGSLAALHLLVYALFLARLPHQPARPQAIWNRSLSAVASKYPDRVVAGAFNAGRVGWVAQEFPSITVTNLDGLVNNAAFAAVKSGEYLQYLERTVDVFLENPQNASLFLRTEEVDELCRVYQKWKGYEVWARD